MTNLHELVWDETKLVSDKLNLLTKKKNELEQIITNRKKIKIDYYYEFTKRLEKETPNNQWKEIVLAIEVIKIIKRWKRKYQIDLRKKTDGTFFINYFRNSIYLADHQLYNLGINYRKRIVTYKTMIIWANKLVFKQIISNEKFNMFMEYLEKNSENNQTSDII